MDSTTEDFSLEELEDYDFSELEDFYSYFDKRPVLLAIYVFLTIFLCLIGIIGNSAIIFMKLRRYHQLNIIECLVVNMAISQIIMIILCMILFIEDILHDVMNVFLCYMQSALIHLSPILIKSTLLALMIILKFFPTIDKKIGYGVICLVWIYSFIFGIPKFSIITIELKNVRGNQGHHMCHVNIEDDEDFDKFIDHYYFLRYFGFVLLSITMFGFFAAILFWKTEKVTNNRNIYIYSISVLSYFWITSFPAELGALEMIHFHSNYLLDFISFHYFTLLLNHATFALNPVIYYYFDKTFYNETMDYLKKIFKSKDENDEIMTECITNENQNEFVNESYNALN